MMKVRSCFPHLHPQEEMLDVIDLGAGSDAGRGRVWVLDPVDGTATFLRGRPIRYLSSSAGKMARRKPEF